jgi:hypothetical protein
MKVLPVSDLDVEESPRTPRLGGSSVDVNQSGPSTCSERTIINCSRTYRAVNSRERKRKGGYYCPRHLSPLLTLCEKRASGRLLCSALVQPWRRAIEKARTA